MTEQTKEKKVPSEQKVKLVPNNMPVDEVYIDGILGVIGRGGVFKLDCYRVVGFDNKEQAEVRQLAHRLVLPVTAMNELAHAIQLLSNQSKKEQDDNQSP